MLNVCIQISALFDVEYHLEDLSPTGRTVSLTYNPENDGHAKIATVENHQAVIMIRKHYPEYEPEPDLIRNPPSSSPTWWERMPAKPSPENCPECAAGRPRVKPWTLTLRRTRSGSGAEAQPP